LAYTIEILAKAEKDLEHWLKHNQNKLRKIVLLLRAIIDAPFNGIGEPEPLKHGLSGYWSRRIDLENRILYKVKGNTVFIVRCKGHYE
jgi:toxin YoeB